jgi:hypothetical protein
LKSGIDKKSFALHYRYHGISNCPTGGHGKLKSGINKKRLALYLHDVYILVIVRCRYCAVAREVAYQKVSTGCKFSIRHRSSFPYRHNERGGQLAMVSLKFHPGLPCPTLLRVYALMAVSGVSRLQPSLPSWTP